MTRTHYTYLNWQKPTGTLTLCLFHGDITGKWHTWIIVYKHTKRYLIWLLLHLKNTQVLAKININCIWNQFAIPQSTVKLKINNHVMKLQIVKTLSSLGTWYIQQYRSLHVHVYMLNQKFSLLKHCKHTTSPTLSIPYVND